MLLKKKIDDGKNFIKNAYNIIYYIILCLKPKTWAKDKEYKNKNQEQK